MDSNVGFFANRNFSRELDQFFCGLLSRCAEFLQDDEEKEPIKENYLCFHQPKLLTQYGSDPTSINNNPSKQQDEALHLEQKLVLERALNSGFF